MHHQTRASASSAAAARFAKTNIRITKIHAKTYTLPLI